MASIQILEISPAETPIEDLSYDVAGNVTGGGLVRDILFETFDFVRDVLKETFGFCSEAVDPQACATEIIDRVL